MLYVRAVARTVFALQLGVMMAGMLPASSGIPIAIGVAQAQEIDKEVWHALMLSPYGDEEEALYIVEETNGGVEAFMEWRTGRVRLHEHRREDGVLSFTWDPYFPMECRLERAASGQFKGSCQDANGGIGPVVLSPPRTGVQRSDLDLDRAYSVWGLTEEEYQRSRRGPLTPEEELQELERSMLPTKAVLLDGRRVNVASGGDGSVTVVFESGFGDDHTVWEAVQSEVGSIARTLSYDRAGLGQSEPSSALIRTPSEQADELHSLLKAGGHAPPYLLVGHGSASFTLRRFMEKYADEVAGVVLVNPSHESEDDEWQRIDADSWRAYVERKRSFLEALSDAAKREFDGYLQVLSKWDGGGATRKADVPSIVLSPAKPAESPDWVGEGSRGMHVRAELQRSFAKEFGAEFRPVMESTGYIQLDAPSAVIEAIVSVLESPEKMP